MPCRYGAWSSPQSSGVYTGEPCHQLLYATYFTLYSDILYCTYTQHIMHLHYSYTYSHSSILTYYYILLYTYYSIHSIIYTIYLI